MAKHYITNAYLTTKKLKFENGTWKRNGRYKLSSGASGKFELYYFNNYQQEAFIEQLGMPDSFKYIKSDTFYKNQHIFINQILEIIKPKVDEELAIVKEEEAKIENPKITITGVFPLPDEKQIGTKFKIGDEEKDCAIFLEKQYDDEWDWKFRIQTIHRDWLGFNSSTWMQELWEQIKEEPDAKFPLILM